MTNCNENCKKTRELIGEALINLINRQFYKIRLINFEEIITQFPPSLEGEILEKKFEENPDVTIVIGNKKIENPNVVYVNSSGWSIYYSKIQPSGWSDIIFNPLTAIYIAAFTIGEIFKTIFSHILSIELKDEFIYDFISHGKFNQPVNEYPIPENIPINIVLIGGGGVGQAFIYAISKLTFSGEISIIDNDLIDESNLQRYVLSFREHIGMQKTSRLVTYLDNHYKNPHIKYIEYLSRYEEAIHHDKSLFSKREYIITVDNIATRKNLQAALPFLIWNIWTHTEERELSYGIGKHAFNSPYECLACVYFTSKKTQPNEMEMNAEILNMPVEEIKARIQSGSRITEEDISKFLRDPAISPKMKTKLKKLKGKPFSAIFHTPECGVYFIPESEKHEPTTATHVPLLAGTYGAIQWILSKMDIDPNYSFEGVAEFDAFFYPNEDCIQKKEKNPKCICSDQDYIDTYNAKWNI